MAVGVAEGVEVAVGGTGVKVNVAVEIGVAVGSGIEGTQATSNTSSTKHNPERGMRVSLGNSFEQFHKSLAKFHLAQVLFWRKLSQGLIALIYSTFGVL